jgi:ABC-type phosphate/phosphonate transport system substrate-binding protein
MSSPILVGAVIYDPKVALIWDIIKDFFVTEGCSIDYVFYSNYELQVDALLAGHIHIAWNSPLAWVDGQRRTNGKCRAIAMRDTDRDRVTHIVARKGTVRSLGDLRGKRVATGAKDSPQATLLPLHAIRNETGLVPYRDFEVRRFDLLVGKHGDHIGGEREAMRALEKGEVDASCVLDLNWKAWTADGSVDGSRLEVVATTPPFDHCNFTVFERAEGDVDRWTKTLMKMSYENPAHREMMDMEGLEAWLPGRTSGYAALTEAAKEQKFFEL